MTRRVVVTGIGTVTSIGVGRGDFWDGLLAGRSGITPVASMDTSRYEVHSGGEVKAFAPAPWFHKLAPAATGRASQFGIVAARLALDDAGIDSRDIKPETAGVSMGTTSGEPDYLRQFHDDLAAGTVEQAGPEADLLLYPAHTIAANMAAETGFEGVNATIPCACAAGNYAIAYAFDAVRSHRADLMLAGGADAFARVAFTGFARLGAVAPEVCRPFARNRKGMIPGEGAAVLVLEPLDSAEQRGARIYAEISGYGFSCDAYHMTSAHPEGDGAARAMNKALTESGLEPEDVSYISAHGTGTPTNDRLETIAVKRVFGESAYRTPISSIKSMLGHTMGAASAIEAATCAMAIYESRIPPTMNLDEPDPDCDLDYVPNRAREGEVRVAMSNAFAFGGANASLILANHQHSRV
jgi:3-oxoacyl-[acyl-carrier-protein] synthase II